MTADTYRLVVAIMLGVGIVTGTVIAIIGSRRRHRAYAQFLAQRLEAIERVKLTATPIAKPPARPSR